MAVDIPHHPGDHSVHEDWKEAPREGHELEDEAVQVSGDEKQGSVNVPFWGF